jgi:ferredoxin
LAGVLLEEWTINRELRDADAGPGERTADSANAASLRAAEPSSPSAAHQHIGWTRPDTVNVNFTAKSAALDALMALAPFEPVANVGYTSRGRLLLLADTESAPRAVRAAEALGSHLPVAIIWRGTPANKLPEDVEAVRAEVKSLAGYLGAFEVVFQPESGAAQMASFDLVLDLANPPRFSMHQPPQGYFRASDEAALSTALAEIPEMVGEFEKPKFFAYKESICAHSRSKKTGCNQCIDVCSTKAISSAGDIVKVDPYLCMGCGACATVCPSGAMSYQYPRVADRGAQLRAALGGYRTVSPGPATILFHNGTDGRAQLDAMLTAESGLPAYVLPIETWHTASVGIDVMLGAIAYGAKQVVLLMAGSEAPEYRAALAKQMETAQVILNSLGFAGKHFAVLAPQTAADIAAFFAANPGGETVAAPATFHLSNDKRGTLEFVVEHLLKSAKTKPAEIALPAGSLYGRVNVDVKKCTLCLACAGACPESALMDGGDYPRLKFLERNCVQCGLCEKTCPENAISLTPRLLLSDVRKQEVTLNETEPFDCISCGKALGTKAMIDNMLGKLAGHSMFQGDGKLNRLKMCADCRVVDMMSNKAEYSVLTGKPIE